MNAPFDPSAYTRAPKVRFASAITLARALVVACPKTMPASVKRSCQKLLRHCERAEIAWTARHRELGSVGDEDSRPVDALADRAWTALRDRAAAHAMLPVEPFPRAERAAELVQMLFPDPSLPFLRGTYTEQLAVTQGILRRVDEDGLAKDLDLVCGPEFLANVRAVMPRYEAMVQAMLARDGGSGDNLRDLLRGLQQAIVSYATKVCATVDDDDGGASAEKARIALLAIENMRAQSARRADRGGEVAATPVTPAPKTTPAPAGSSVVDD